MSRDQVAKLFGMTADEVDDIFKVGMRVEVEGYSVSGVILAIPLEVGYPIAVEFDTEVVGGSTCEGIGKKKQCRWVRPDRVKVVTEK